MSFNLLNERSAVATVGGIERKMRNEKAPQLSQESCYCRGPQSFLTFQGKKDFVVHRISLHQESSLELQPTFPFHFSGYHSDSHQYIHFSGVFVATPSKTNNSLYGWVISRVPIIQFFSNHVMDPNPP